MKYCCFDNKHKDLEINGLYYVDIKIKEFQGYKDVIMVIFRWNDKNIPFTPKKYFPKCLSNLSHEKKVYCLECFKESFIMDEIVMIREYISNFKNTIVSEPYSCSINEDGSSYPIGGLPVGGDTDFYCFFKHRNYPLNFLIAGYFDLRQHEKTMEGLR